MIRFLVLLLVATVGGIVTHSYPRGSRGRSVGIGLLAFVFSSLTAWLW